MSVSAALLDFAVQLIGRIGYLGVGFILVVDNAGVPIPSEAILALAGATARNGAMQWPVVVGLGIVMQTLGACLAYAIGQYGAGPLIRRYGKYVLISAEDFETTRRWFERRGPRAIFISRLTPVVRSFMGFAAGSADMKFGSYFVQTLAGSAVWTALWVGFGYALGNSWREYYGYMHYLDYMVLILLGGFAVRFVWLRRNGR